MKIKTEVSGGEEEIIIRCNKHTDKIRSIEAVLENMLRGEREILLHMSSAEHYVNVHDILFFESGNNKVYAHTADSAYTSDNKLFELEDILPSSFVRVSKSCIVNIMPISSLKRELVGNGEISFKNSGKTAYFSRSYYKILRDKIDEMRLKK